jgi:hypothetical protein
MKRTLLALAAVTLLTGAALAAGNFTGLPAATGAGSPSAGAPTTGGGPINPAGCIPMDTGFPSGINPATQCVSPSQLAAASQGAALSYATAQVGAVPLASVGNNTTPVAGTIYVAQLNLPAFTVTNISCLNGSAAATDSLVYGLYNATGNLVASTALAGVVAAGVNGFQAQIPLISPYVAAAGLYFVAYQANGTTTRFRTITANGAGDLTASYTGAFGTLPSITPPAAFAPNVGPICYVN